MDALTFIVFGFIAYWSYWSIKHEGVFWIPTTATLLGGFFLFIWMTFKIASQVKPAWFVFFVIMSSGGIMVVIANKFVLWCDKKVEERVGLDLYKTN